MIKSDRRTMIVLGRKGGVVQISSNVCAFAALKSDGSAVAAQLYFARLRLSAAFCMAQSDLQDKTGQIFPREVYEPKRNRSRSSMNQPAARLACYQDLLDLPENLVGEIIHGTLITHPRPAPKHALASSAIGSELFAPFHKGHGGLGGWWILDEPEVHLGSQVLVPDLAGWRRERLPTLPDTAYFEIAPDWVCEVLSPSTARIDRADKLPIYAQHEVAWCWLVDPDLRTVEVLQRQERQWLLVATWKDDAQAQAPPFAAITIDLAHLWA